MAKRSFNTAKHWIPAGAAFGLIFLTAGAALLVSGLVREPSPGRAGTVECREHLGRIGEVLRALREAGQLESTKGAAFLLQALPCLGNDEAASRRAGDPASRRACSYVGPGRATAAAFAGGTLPPDAVLAYCPHHGEWCVELLASGETRAVRR